MRKIFLLFIAITLVFSLAACGNSSESPDSNSTGQSSTSTDSQNEVIAGTNNSDSDNADNVSNADNVDGSGGILIAYFTAAQNSGVDAVSSASVTVINDEPYGVSQAVANMIAAETGGDLFSIQTSVVYPAEFGPLADYAAEEQDNGTLPELTTHIENLGSYDTIFVGFPIWWYDMPQVMYSFFEEYDFSGKTIIPFTVHNGSRLSGTPAAIQELEPDATVIQDGFTVSHSNAADAAGDVTEWLRGLGY